MSRKLTVRNDWCMNNSHTRGGVPSGQSDLDLPQGGPSHLTFCGGLRFFCFCFFCFCFWKCQGSVPWHPLTTDWEQHASVAFKNGIGNFMTLECISHLQCLDFPMCAQLQVVKQKYTYHPYYCYSVATEPYM